MPLKQQLDSDLKAAMLGGDKQKVSVLRGVKSVILNAEIAAGKRDSGLSDDELLALLSKEAKKRVESAELYVQGGNRARADEELAEKAVIDAYLPSQLSEAELTQVINEIIETTGASGPQAMGQVIGAVKAKVGAQADGAIIARLVKEKLT